MTVAPLNYTSTSGYYGLQVRPSFDQVLGTIRKPLRVPLPDRRAKWYANSPYRALILDAEKAANDYEHARIDYRQSGGELPEAAARVHPSAAGDDEAWDEIEHHHGRMEAHEAYEHAFDLANERNRRHANAMQHEHHRLAHGPNRMHWTISAHHPELEEAGVRHNMPAHRVNPPQGRYRAPPMQWEAEGIPQPVEFPTLEQLNGWAGPGYMRGTHFPERAGTSYESLRRSAGTST